MDQIVFEVQGRPFGKQRPRATRQGRIYTPKETVQFEHWVKLVAQPFFDAPLDGPVKLTVLATFKPAKSWSKKKTREHLGRPHTQKPDADNCSKCIKDALNSVAFHDDAQVSDLIVRKRWGPENKTVVFVEAV